MTRVTMRTPYPGDLEQGVKLCNHITVMVKSKADINTRRCEYVETVKIFCAECAEFHKIRVLIN